MVGPHAVSGAAPSTPAILRGRRNVRLGVLDPRLVPLDANNGRMITVADFSAPPPRPKRTARPSSGNLRMVPILLGLAIVRAFPAAYSSADAPKSALSQLSPMQG